MLLKSGQANICPTLNIEQVELIVTGRVELSGAPPYTKVKLLARSPSLDI